MARAIRNFNLENRAEREISKMKPSPAPRHPSTQSLLREQMNCEWCEGASGPASGVSVPAGQFRLGCRGPGDAGRPQGLGRPSAGRGSHRAGDIEPAP